MYFDILMIYGLSRAHNCYPNIVKHFKAQGLSVGLIYDLPEKIKKAENLKPNRKLQETEKVFIALCESLGAVICKPEGEYECNLLVFPQAHFQTEFADWVRKSIKSKNKIGILLFTGSAQGIESSKGFGVKRFYTNDKRAIWSNTEEQKLEALIRDVEILSMGSPDKICPIFENFCIDYLVALPTPLQFKTMNARFGFYKNIFTLIESIPKEDKVIIKRHSSKDGGNTFYPKSEQMPVGLAKFAIRFYPRILEQIPRPVGTVIKNFLCLCMDRLILNRTKSLAELSPYSNLGVEFFLPSVQKGVITGLSAVMWHCLAYGVRVYNCDSRPIDATNSHWSHLQYYAVPWCENKLEFDSRKCDILPRSIQGANFLKEIEKDLGRTFSGLTEMGVKSGR